MALGNLVPGAVPVATTPTLYNIKREFRGWVGGWRTGGALWAALQGSFWLLASSHLLEIYDGSFRVLQRPWLVPIFLKIFRGARAHLQERR